MHRSFLTSAFPTSAFLRAAALSFVLLIGCGSEKQITDPPTTGGGTTSSETTGAGTGTGTGGGSTGGGTRGACQPSCAGKDCGPDGCGGFCGICSPGSACTSDGTCQATGCKPKCQGKTCGPDGCGGFCGTCEGGKSCNGAGVCTAGQAGCTPSCEGKLCGDDGCGDLCGKCAPGLVCDGTLFQCIPNANDCGTVDDVGQCQQEDAVAVTCKGGKLIAIVCDPTKGLKCGFNEAKNKYGCIKSGCVPACDGKACGSDGCGGICGQCSPSDICNAQGKCQSGDVCDPNCNGKTCGPDGCGGQCGICDAGQNCANGECLDPTACTPACAAKACGPDGCGGSCGTCKPNESCDAGTCMLSTCVPNCAAKACGSDGCGGQCGQCPSGQTCDGAGHCVTPGDCGSLTYEGTCDGDTVTWCEGGAIESQDCKNYGADYQCAWIENQETYWCTNTCQAACGVKECGADGCGGTCGVCPGDETCNDAGLCIAPGGGGDCGDISWEGICEGNTLKYCSLLDQSLVTFNCGTLGKKCGWDAGQSFNSCVASTDGCTPNCLLNDGSPKGCGDDGCGNLCGVCEVGSFCNAGTCSAGAGACGDITVTGECNGDTLVYCAGGALYDQDCGGQNMTCGFDESGPDGGWFDCLESTEPAPTCGPVPEQGVCANNTLTYCKAGKVETLSCTDAGLQCLYSPTGNGGAGGYDCYDDPGCALTCPQNQRCQFDGTCGCDGITVEGHCEGTMLVWCNGEGLVQSDCGANGCGLSNDFATCL